MKGVRMKVNEDTLYEHLKSIVFAHREINIGSRTRLIPTEEFHSQARSVLTRIIEDLDRDELEELKSRVKFLEVKEKLLELKK